MVRGLSLVVAGLIGLSGGPMPAQAQPAAALAQLKAEPTCPQVQQAALAFFNISKEQMKRFQKGAALKALAPVMEFSGGYVDSQLDESTRDLMNFPNSPWLLKGAGGNAWDARGKLSWNLPQLVFNAEVLDVASLAGLVQSVLKEVTRLYYMRRRLQIDLLLNPPGDEASQLTKELRLEELTAMLDAMTGGYFSRELEKGRKAASPANAGDGEALFE